MIKANKKSQLQENQQINLPQRIIKIINSLIKTQFIKMTNKKLFQVANPLINQQLIIKMIKIIKQKKRKELQQLQIKVLNQQPVLKLMVSSQHLIRTLTQIQTQKRIWLHQTKRKPNKIQNKKTKNKSQHQKNKKLKSILLQLNKKLRKNQNNLLQSRTKLIKLNLMISQLLLYLLRHPKSPHLTNTTQKHQQLNNKLYD